MTTPEEAIQALELANAGKLSPEAKALITHAVSDPFVRMWPEITGHQRAIAGVATRISELLDLTCMTGDPKAPEFNSLLAYQALYAAIGHLLAGIPAEVQVSDERLTKLADEATNVATELRDRYQRSAALEPGDLVGILTVEGLEIPIVKMPDPTPPTTH